MAEFIFSAFADEAGGGLLSQIDALKANGITHIEPRGLDEGNISTFSAEQAKAVKKILDEHGIGVSSVGSHFGKINIKDSFDEHFESFKQCVENANILGTENTHLISAFGSKKSVGHKQKPIITELLHIGTLTGYIYTAGNLFTEIGTCPTACTASV